MPTKPLPDLKFDIGHVLFIDTAGYSKLMINEQSEQIQTLKQIVRGFATIPPSSSCLPARSRSGLISKERESK